MLMRVSDVLLLRKKRLLNILSGDVELSAKLGKEVEKITGNLEGEIEGNIDPYTMVTIQYGNRWNSPDILENRK